MKELAADFTGAIGRGIDLDVTPAVVRAVVHAVEGGLGDVLATPNRLRMEQFAAGLARTATAAAVQTLVAEAGPALRTALQDKELHRVLGTTSREISHGLVSGSTTR